MDLADLTPVLDLSILAQYERASGVQVIDAIFGSVDVGVNGEAVQKSGGNVISTIFGGKIENMVRLAYYSVLGEMRSSGKAPTFEDFQANHMKDQNAKILMGKFWKEVNNFFQNHLPAMLGQAEAASPESGSEAGK